MILKSLALWTTRGKRNIHFVFLLVFLGILYFQLKDFKYSSVSFSHFYYFFFALLLVQLNWLMEYLKWGKLLIFLKLPTEKKRISFASGMISDFLIPGIPSNFIGRIGYFESNQRMSLAAWISLTNSIQFFITALFGLISIFLLKIGNGIPIIFLLVVLLVGIVLFFSQKFQKFLSRKFSMYDSAEINRSELKYFIVQISLVSLLRMLIFTTQFYCLLLFFGIPAKVDLFLWIWLSYLAVTASPSLILGKLAVRETITAAIFQLGSFPLFPVVTASFCIWLINGFIPVFIAWLFVWKNTRLDQ